jgi:hypothetical protein
VAVRMRAAASDRGSGRCSRRAIMHRVAAVPCRYNRGAWLLAGSDRW